jgi:hypothetical protein
LWIARRLDWSWEYMWHVELIQVHCSPAAVAVL